MSRCGCDVTVRQSQKTYCLSGRSGVMFSGLSVNSGNFLHYSVFELLISQLKMYVLSESMFLIYTFTLGHGLCM